MPRLRASIANAYAETFPRGRSLADFLHKPERKTAQVIMVWRIRGERKLPHDKAETVFALAMNDEEAFGRLLHLSGLDPHEIEDHGLTFRKLQSPVNLLEKLQELTGDEYGMATQEMTLPLLRSVVHQIMVDPETADDL
ncbi:MULTISPECIES: hypothetical protein [Methylobacterium]|uniref:Uncharacterized protein n=1 Tax=Methylobacterium radiotolerans TaxID=31998 RepID=A0ABV2NTX1_9HYPH|nr:MULTISPECIES: hypothetical protein [unclassified Methylobacterium]MBP2498335.1 hypothetical protein [Methylobacterium sp. PvP105]MBP2505719.1 hypothetical protein [Methylobacterium sp. PvP109]